MKQGLVITTGGTVLGGLILLILQLYGLLPRVFSGVWGGVSWIVGTLVSSHSIPGWAVLALGLFALLGTIVLGMKVIATLRDTQEHRFINYTEAEVDGVIWRWRWEGRNIVELVCFCPRCDTQLVYDEDFFETRYICERCPSDGSVGRGRGTGRVVTRVEGKNRWYLANAAGREITRRIREMERESGPG